MTFKQIKEHKVVKFLFNKYVIVLLLFAVWMLFLDDNSYINHKELDDEIKELERTNEYYRQEIKADKGVIDNLNNPDSLEKFAREQYKMKREDEDIFLIEYDTIKE